MVQMIWLVEQDDSCQVSCQTCQSKASKFTNGWGKKLLKNTELECINASASSWFFSLKNQDGKVNCSMKSGWFAAHENLDVINMAIEFENKLLQACGWYLLRRVLWMNNSLIHGSKRIARAVDTVRNTGLLWPFTQCSGEDIWTSSQLFTRRTSVVISEACFKCCGERR